MKKLFIRKSLTLRIWITFVIFVVIIISAISFFYLFLVRNINRSNQLEILETNHEMLLQVITQANDFDPSKPPQFDPDNPRFISHITVKTDCDFKTVSVFPFGRFPKSTPEQLENLSDWFLSLSQNEVKPNQTISSHGTYSGNKYLFIVTPIEDPNDASLSTYFISYIILHESNKEVSLVIVIGLLFIIIALIVSKIISNYISKPLKQLEQQTLKIAHKEWIEPMPITSEDEIGSLIRSINFMQNALQKADQEERQFLQSISHDLKTPIMVIIGHAEAIKDGIYIDSLENTANIIKTEALRLENKVKQILYYNTLDYTLPNDQDFQEIDLSRFTNHLVNCFKNIRPDLEWQLSLKEILIRANSERLLVAFENILDNQIRYANKFIRIVLRKDDKYAIIHISNDGPNIPADQLPNLFKNLYRGTNGKFGLGLAITYKIITFYGGNLTVENSAIGVTFKIRLPLCTP